MNDPLLALVSFIASKCISISEQYDKECAQFIYQDNVIGAPTLGTRNRVLIWSDPNREPIALLHTHRHRGTPNPSSIDIQFANSAAMNCSKERFFVVSLSGEVVEYTSPLKLPRCESNND